VVVWCGVCEYKHMMQHVCLTSRPLPSLSPLPLSPPSLHPPHKPIKGTAWFSEPTGADTAHPQMECSNRGICNTGTGACACQAGFTGAACDRIDCHHNCGGIGLCRTNKELSVLKKQNGTTRSPLVTYGATPNKVRTMNKVYTNILAK
jgi:hypothetical protein